jgi:hypothetical protein
MSNVKVERENITPRNLGDFVDPNSGETIGSIMQNHPGAIASIVAIKKSRKEKWEDEREKVDTRNYVTVDAEIVFELTALLKNCEISRLLKMALDVNTDENFIWDRDNERPHTNSSLPEYLGMKSYPNYSSFMSKMKKLGIVKQRKHLIGNRRVNVFTLNPYIARKRKYFLKSELDKYSKNFNWS